MLVAHASFGVAGVVLDPLAAVIMTMGLGIAVDDTIHLLVRVREELDHGASNADAIATAVSRSGLAVAVTTFVLTGGLCINLLSSFPALRLLGALGAMIMVLALVADVFLLPALLSYRRV